MKIKIKLEKQQYMMYHIQYEMNYTSQFLSLQM